MFWQATRLIARYGASRLMMVCMAVTVMRWTVTGLLAHSLPVMVLAANTHARSFAVFHACCMQLMAEYFPGKRAAAGQSLRYGFSSVLGGVLGAGMSALAWKSAGGGRLAFLLGAGVTAVTWVVYALRRRGSVAAA